MKALTAFNRNISGVNCVEIEKKEALTAISVGMKELTAFNWKNSGVRGVELEKWRR